MNKVKSGQRHHVEAWIDKQALQSTLPSILYERQAKVVIHRTDKGFTELYESSKCFNKPKYTFSNILREAQKQIEGSFVSRNVKSLGLDIHGVRISDRLILGSAKAAFISYRLFVHLFFNTEKRTRLRKSGSLNFASFFLYRFVNVFGLRNKVFQIALPKYGIKSWCRSRDRFNDYIILTTWENELVDKWFMPKEGDVVIDAGSHIGLYSMVSSRRVGASGKVIAIEADSSNFKTLLENIRLNGLNNVVAVNCILYSKDMPFSLSRYDAILVAGRRGGIMGQEREQKIQEEQMRQSLSSNSSESTINHATTLDSVLQQTADSINRANWIKIDVEGAELDVLKGATRTLAANQNIAILIEIHRSWLYEPILDLLRKYNFKLQAEWIYGGESVYAHILVSKSPYT
jgi:FkbM family methyltransferase